MYYISDILVSISDNGSQQRYFILIKIAFHLNMSQLKIIRKRSHSFNFAVVQRNHMDHLFFKH